MAKSWKDAFVAQNFIVLEYYGVAEWVMKRAIDGGGYRWLTCQNQQKRHRQFQFTERQRAEEAGTVEPPSTHHKVQVRETMKNGIITKLIMT